MNDSWGEAEPERTLRRDHPRGRFRLTARGRAALETYLQGVVIAQSGHGGREPIEEFQASWARLHGLADRTALLLEEMAPEPRNVTELCRGLASCGMPKAAIEDGIDRLAEVGLIEFAPTNPR